MPKRATIKFQRFSGQFTSAEMNYLEWCAGMLECSVASHLRDIIRLRMQADTYYAEQTAPREGEAS